MKLLPTKGSYSCSSGDTFPPPQQLLPWRLVLRALEVDVTLTVEDYIAQQGSMLV